MYKIILKDNHANDIVCMERETVREARKCALYLISNRYPQAHGTTHASLMTHKVEVIDAAGDIIIDKFLIN